MEGDGFSEADGEEVLRGEVVYGDIEAQLSYVLGTADGARNIEEDLNQLSLGVSADFGNYNVVLAYQDESDEAAGFYDAANGDFVDSQVWGISVGTSFAGADVRVAYAEEDGADESLGFEVSYPFGPVTATAYYVVEDDEAGNDDPNYGLTLAYSEGPVAVTFDYDNDQGTNKYGLEGSYDVGNGLVVYGGYLFIEDLADESAFYVGGEYDLGSGAALLVSYAEGDDDEYEDEIGAQDYQDGTTVEISFDF